MEIRNVAKLEYYKQFKVDFCYEKYLDILTNSKQRELYTKFRISAHNLEIEVGRYTGIERQNRICKLCQSQSVESEYHFLLCCNKYYDLRQKYFTNNAWPSVQKFINIMSSKRRTSIVKNAKFLTEAYKLRSLTLENNAAS